MAQDGRRVVRDTPLAICAKLAEDFAFDPEGGILAVVVGSRRDVIDLVERLRPLVANVDVHEIADIGRLNAARDSLIRPRHVVLVRLDDLDQFERVRREAPDLHDWIEGVNILDPPQPDPALLEVERKRYLERLVERWSTLDLTGLIPGFTQPWRLPLEDVYIELPPVDPQTGASERRRLLTGHPGAGKTTFLRHCVVADAREGLTGGGASPFILPVLVPAAAYARALAQRIRPLAEYIGEEIQSHQHRHGQALIQRAGKDLRVYVDALDEVPGESLALVAQNIADFARDNPGSVLVTSRPAHVVALTRTLEGFARFTLRAPARKQVEIFVDKFLAAYAAATGSQRSRERAAELRTRLREPDLVRLTATPLTLTFLVLLHVVEGRLPERRVSLYHRLAELLVERWNMARSLSGPRKGAVPYGEALRVFAPLAWWMLQKRPSGFVEEDALVARLVAQLTERGELQESAERATREFLDRMRRDMLILLPTDDRQWYFFHPTVAEYLAGVEVSRNHRLRRELIQRRRLFDPQMREVLIFSVGELGLVRADDDSLHELVQAILDQSRRPGRYDARYVSLLVGVLLEDAGLNRADELALVNRIVDFGFHYTYSRAERMDADIEVLRALQYANDRTTPVWRTRLEGLFVTHVDVQLLRILAENAFVFHDPHLNTTRMIRGRLLSRLPRMLERLGASPLPLLKHLVRDDSSRMQCIGWFAAIDCSDSVRRELASIPILAAGDSLFAQLAGKLREKAVSDKQGGSALGGGEEE